MTYNFKRLWHITYLSLFKSKGTPARLTPKRIVVLIGFYFLYTILEIINWTCFALDRIFYPEFLKVEVKSPVFIIGNPRSGTTFLHRLLARDEDHFLSILLWEIIFAPSIVQRKLWGLLVSFDRFLGHPIRNIVHRIEARLFNPNKMHRIRLRMPEEDEYLMMHEGTTILAGLFFGIPEASLPFVSYDLSLSDNEKTKAIEFYKRCIQRHLYYHGQNRIFLSKNPFFSPKVDTLLKAFPDACFIYMLRNPMNVVPSYASISAFWWHVFCDARIKYPYTDFILNVVQHWYRYPLERLEKDPRTRYLVLRFDELTGNPQKAVQKIYQLLELQISSAFAGVLGEETLKSRQYKSQHNYSLEQVGYTREQIKQEFMEVFQRWSFDENA